MRMSDAFVCVRCGLTCVGQKREFVDFLILRGDVAPGPHCQMCTYAVTREISQRHLAAQAESERKRREALQATPCPPDVDPRLWVDIQRHGCCANARPFRCVCAISLVCPDHGYTHVGTHD